MSRTMSCSCIIGTFCRPLPRASRTGRDEINVESLPQQRALFGDVIASARTPNSRRHNAQFHGPQRAKYSALEILAACTPVSPCLLLHRPKTTCLHCILIATASIRSDSRTFIIALQHICGTTHTMEALLSLAFDNIASKDTQKIRKGLRQIEGMLAQICLSGSKSKTSTPGHRRNASAINLGEQQESTPKKLGQLSEDPAFREFFRLQEGFEWNGKGCTNVVISHTD
jgi:hypothetical protein